MIKFMFSALAVVFSFSLWASGGGGQTENHLGVYAVPVSPADLIRYSIFSGLDIEVRKFADGKIKIEYSLPKELTGVENNLEFEGQPDGTGIVTLSGVNGSATCEIDTVVHRCEMAYKNIIFDGPARDTLLEQLALGNPDALAYRKSVAEQFEQMIIASPSPAIRSGAIGSGIIGSGGIGSGAIRIGGEVHGILVIQ